MHIRENSTKLKEKCKVCIVYTSIYHTLAVALYIYQGIGAYYKFIIEYMLKGQCHLMYQTFVLIKLMIFNFLVDGCTAILP